MRRFKVAMIGCGNVSRMHFDAYREHADRVEVVAACDPVRENRDHVRDQYGVERVFASLDEMLAGAEFEVGVVCTPTPVRGEVVGTLAGAGKQVFVEKPFAESLDEASEMVGTCDRSGVLLAVNQNFRYHYPFDIARQVIGDGRIGNVVQVTHQDLMFRRDQGWRTRVDRHAFSVMGVHWLDGLRWMLGDEATTVSCWQRSSPAVECAGDTDVSAQIVFERGTMATIVESFSCPVRRTETIVIGETGTLVLGYTGVTLHHIAASQDPVARWDATFPGDRKPGATFGGLNRLLCAIDEGSEPGNSGRDNLGTIALLDAAYRSAATNAPVQLRDVSA